MRKTLIAVTAVLTLATLTACTNHDENNLSGDIKIIKEEPRLATSTLDNLPQMQGYSNLPKDWKYTTEGDLSTIKNKDGCSIQTQPLEVKYQDNGLDDTFYTNMAYQDDLYSNKAPKDVTLGESKFRVKNTDLDFLTYQFDAQSPVYKNLPNGEQVITKHRDTRNLWMYRVSKVGTPTGTKFLTIKINGSCTDLSAFNRDKMTQIMTSAKLVDAESKTAGEKK